MSVVPIEVATDCENLTVFLMGVVAVSCATGCGMKSVFAGSDDQRQEKR